MAVARNKRTAFSLLKTVPSFLKTAPGNIKVSLHAFKDISDYT